MANKWNDAGVISSILQKFADRMELACEYLEGDMKARATGHMGEELKAFDLGNYANSFYHKVRIDGSVIEGIVYNTAEYSPHIEFGTGEYAEDGEGRKGGWVYPDPKTGELKFTLGMKPRPVMRSSFIEGQESLKTILGVQ
jgi:hypothetical protein